MEIRAATAADFDQIWSILDPVFSAGETYAFPRDMDREAIRRIWMETPDYCYVAVDGEQILGTYFLKTNFAGGGSHVCNCGYVVAAQAGGRGIARAMCEHSQDVARRGGYLAMQFNFVVSTNTGALALWQKLGFQIVGTVPDAFEHPSKGYVDTHILHKSLI